jgi:hypothetical protein
MNTFEWTGIIPSRLVCLKDLVFVDRKKDFGFGKPVE